MIGLFRTTNWFGTSRASGTEEQLVGVWWELLRHGGDNALGLIKISYAEQEQQIKLNGSAFTAEGAVHARFWSSAVALNAAKLHLHYFWQGDENQSDENFSGVGYIRFTRSAEDRQVDRGTGWFTTGDIDRANVTDKKKVEFRRASEEESHVMSSTDRQAIQRLVSSVYSRWASRPGKTTTEPGLTG